MKAFPFFTGLAILASVNFLSSTNVLAQDIQMVPPPVPAVPPSPPPQPDPALQPTLQWEPLAPQGNSGDAALPEPALAPPPEAEGEIAPPPVPLEETPLPGPPDPSDKELVEPDVEVWRQESESPQSPPRYGNQLNTAYMTGTEPVTLRVQFDVRAAGRSVFARPGRGLSVEPANTILYISSEGECVLTARLAEGTSRSYILFYCDGIRTILPISRASALQVTAAEEGREVDAPETAAVPPPDENPEGNTGALKPQIQTGGSYDAHSGNATRIVNDLHVPGALGDYGLDFTRYWNSVPNDNDNSYAVLPSDFGTSGWSHSWGWYAMEEDTSDQPGGDGTEEIYTTAITITFPDGHATRYKITRSNYGHGAPWGPDPRCGPPYFPDHRETDWLPPGAGVSDLLGEMAYDGSQFWLRLADGGAVHFIAGPDYGGPRTYQASEVFDPHGFRTGLHYTGGLLDRVEQDGGRWLTLNWGTIPNWTAPLITTVETGGPAGWQRVTYKYQWFPASDPHFVVLSRVIYYDEPAPGQSVAAHYSYGTCFGDGEPCNGTPSLFPLLKTADDPHYDGPMTKIRYNYRGTHCDIPAGPWYDSYPGEHLNWFGTSAEAIREERNGVTGQVVSSFAQGCSGGGLETNGFGGWRALYYGNVVYPHTDDCRGYQLARITDFTSQFPLPSALPYRQQDYRLGIPHSVWDARRNQTVMDTAPGDTSGMVGVVHHIDGSARHYDRVNPGNSATILDSGMHNPFTHWLFSKTDENGNKTTYTRDERRRITHISVTNVSGQVVSTEDFTYNGLNQVTSHTMPSGAVQTYQYDGNNRLVAEYDNVDPAGDRREYTYDTLERVATMKEGRAIRDNAAYTVSMEYNGRHQVTKVHYRPVSGGNFDPTMIYEYDNYGNCTAITDELSHRTTYRYDDYRRCIEMTEPLNACGQTNRTWNWFYDRWIEERSPGFGLFGASTHTSKEWRVQVEPAFNVAGDRRVTERNHDINNRLKVETTGLILPSGGSGYSRTADTETHSFTYDPNGMKSTYTDPRGRVTDYTYDNRNRLHFTIEPKRTDQTNRPTTETHYDYIGNKMQIIFPDGKSQSWNGYDAFGQPGQFRDERNNPTDMTYKWGSMKKLDTVTTHRAMDGNGGMEHQQTTFTYDGMGRPWQTFFPDTTTEVNTYEFGQPKTWKTRRGQIKTITYDARGREQSHSWNDGMTPGITRTWDDANRLTGLSNIFSTLDYSYDAAGQMLREGSRVAGGTGDAPITPIDVGYCHYPSGEVSDVAYPSGLLVHRTYTARGQLQGETWAGGSVNYAYFADGKVDYSGYGNGLHNKVEYDGRGFPSMTQTYRFSDGTNYTRRDYWRDNRDRITAWKKAETGRGDRYGYDAEGQLTSAVYDALTPEGTPTNAARSDLFNYDALGNRAEWNWLASRGQMWLQRRDNGLNQYLNWSTTSGWWSPVYHDDNLGTPPAPPWNGPGNGVTMADGLITASYNALNQPMAIYSPALGLGPSGQPLFLWLGYDPLGRCVKRWLGLIDGGATTSNPATYFYYDGWNMIQEGVNANTPGRVYVHGARVDEIVASCIWSGNLWAYHHYDARGHCILLTRPDATTQEKYEYDAFGQPYFYNASGSPLPLVNNRPVSAWGNRFLFTGREWLGEVGLYDYRNRMYQPELGRFMQPDPKEFGAGDYNLYRYCHNDPVNRSDPLGLRSEMVVEIMKRYLPITGSHIPQAINVVKVAFTSLVKATMGDHNDRSQAVYKDGGLSSIGTQRDAPATFKNGIFVHDHYIEEFKLQVGRPLGLLLHVHDDVRPGKSTTGPQVPGEDANAVILNQVPMIFTSTSQYDSHHTGSLVTPNGLDRPTVTPLIFNW